MHTIKYDERVILKDLPKLSSVVRKRIQISIQEKLLLDPVTFGKPLRHSFKNIRSLRVGDYRVAFVLVKKEVQVTCIGHRSKIYTELKRRV